MAAVGLTNASAHDASSVVAVPADRVASIAATPAVSAASTRLPGIDGLRALAVGAVLLFHADLGLADGGFLGVDLFFVVSGFLITRLLLADIDALGRIDYGRFYRRRARRILPPLLVMVACSSLFASTFARDALPALRADALPTLLFFLNWHYVAENLTYFEAMGRQPLLQHCWSLAIEEQFYLVWPVVVWLVARRSRTELGVFAVFAAIASALWMSWQAQQIGFPESLDTARVYFGTDTHAVGLLVGAALAVWLRTDHRTTASPGAAVVQATGLGAAGIAGLIALFVVVQEHTAWLYPYGFVAAAMFAAIAITSCAMPGNALLPLLEWAPIRWLGERSYGVYLWHWPVYLLTRPGVDHSLDTWTTFGLRIGLTLFLAELSFRFVEAPLLGRRSLQPPPAFAAGVMVSFGLVGAFVLLTAVPIANLWPQIDRAPAPASAAVEREPATAQPTVPPPAGPAAVVRAEGGLTVVGDSVMLGARAAIERGISGARVFAHVGWQAKDVSTMLERLRAGGDLSPTVLVHLGTNGHVGEARLRAMLDALADRRLVLIVNTRVPRRWMIDNNAMLARVVPEYRNARLVDWHGAADAHREFFEADGVHLTPVGARAMVGLMIAAAGFASSAEPAPVATDALAADGAAQAGAETAEDFAPGLRRYARPVAPDSYWDAIARCQTGARWQRAGAFAGGLGLDAATWRRYGGTAYGPTADRATRRQQIDVANRLASLGHSAPNGQRHPAVGFGRWQCVRHVPEPLWRVFEPEALLAHGFLPGQQGRAVRELQRLLGVPADGFYNDRTARAHREAKAALASGGSLADSSVDDVDATATVTDDAVRSAASVVGDVPVADDAASADEPAHSDPPPAAGGATPDDAVSAATP